MRKKGQVVHLEARSDAGLFRLFEAFRRESTERERVDLYAYIARKLLLRARPGLKVRHV